MSDLFLLDTNAASHLIRYPTGSVAERVLEKPDGTVALSAIVASELRFGVRKRGSARLAGLIDGVFQRFPVYAYDDSAAARYAETRWELERLGTPIGPLDTLIAAHALALDAVLVTNNTVEFARVRGLKQQDWTQA